MRLFVAIEFPEEVKQGIQLLQKAEAQRLKGFRWSRPDQLHLTMKFLGELDESHVEEAWRALEGMPPVGACTLGFGGFQCLPDGPRPRVIALEITGDVDRLQELHEQLESSFEANGFPRERRPFFPHVTVARRNEWEPLAAAGLWYEKPYRGMFVATEISLIQSRLKPAGAVYETIRRFPF
jgi:2'-5' RNA ligase